MCVYLLSFYLSYIYSHAYIYPNGKGHVKKTSFCSDRENYVGILRSFIDTLRYIPLCGIYTRYSCSKLQQVRDAIDVILEGEVPSDELSIALLQAYGALYT